MPAHATNGLNGVNGTTPLTREYAQSLDQQDPLAHVKNDFICPTKADLKAKSMRKTNPTEVVDQSEESCIYLCGNSLGLQPKRTSQRIQEHLSVWATKGVHGHFFKHDGKAPPPFLDADDAAAAKMAPVVGALPNEVAIMETLTANLHFLMSAFYTPTKDKYKIILEGKAFPSDHYAVQSQIKQRGFNPEDAMVLMEPAGGKFVFTTEEILATIDQHADSTALILLPGIQYYSGQLLDIKTITAHAHSKGILIGWDLAHAVGNVELSLHEWDIDFAAWCTYKYMNSGPGAIAGLFVNERHGKVQEDPNSWDGLSYRPRLSGWWGGRKNVRFNMTPRFVPTPGAAGYQVGNVNALAISSIMSSLEIFEQVGMKAIRNKALSITGFLEKLLTQRSSDENPYWIITPSDPSQRGSQLSVQLRSGLLDDVMEGLDDAGVVLDERKPDVIRIAPAPLYNSYTEVWDFVEILNKSCDAAATKQK